jgi:hypothetical protein
LNSGRSGLIRSRWIYIAAGLVAEEPEDLSTKALVPTMAGVPIALGYVALFSKSVPIRPAWCHRLWPKLAKAADMKYIVTSRQSSSNEGTS